MLLVDYSPLAGACVDFIHVITRGESMGTVLRKTLADLPPQDFHMRGKPNELFTTTHEKQAARHFYTAGVRVSQKKGGPVVSASFSAWSIRTFVKTLVCVIANNDADTNAIKTNYS